MSINSKTIFNKSQHGNLFKKDLLNELKRLKSLGLVMTIELNKKIAPNANTKPQFYAPFYLETSDCCFVIFSTTSVRSDRIKINHWDAAGLKTSFNRIVKCYLVLPNELSDQEQKNFLIESSRIKQKGYVSGLDEIIQLAELEKMFEKGIK